MKKIGLLIVFSALVCSVWAVPARKGGITVTQPDGSQVTVYQHGDEHFHWMTNERGEWLKMDVDGFYRVTEALSVEQIEARRVASSKRAAMAAYPLNIAPRGLVILVNFADLAFETEKAEMDSMLTAEIILATTHTPIIEKHIALIPKVLLVSISKTHLMGNITRSLM